MHFRESWDQMSDEAEADPIARVAQLVREVASVTAEDGRGRAPLPNGLVFTDLAEYSLVDDLSGEALDGHLVTMAKHEEITEV